MLHHPAPESSPIGRGVLSDIRVRIEELFRERGYLSPSRNEMFIFTVLSL